MGFTRLQRLPTSRLPLVLANCVAASADYWSVAPDDAAGGRLAAATLLDLGHRRIAMLTGPPPMGPDETTGNISGPIRADGFRTECTARGIPAIDAPVIEAGWNIADGFHAAIRLLGAANGAPLPSERRPTAVFAVNDRCATGVLLAAARLGLDVPSELSVLGFDDQEALADALVPALTTLALPHATMGQRAVEMLFTAIAEPESPAQQELLSCDLVPRDTLGPPGA